MNLYENLKARTKEWRKSGYKCDYPAIAEIFDYNLIDSENNLKSFRFLRKAQFEALEIYWYLRLVEKTPKVFDLYKRYFKNENLLDALGIRLSEEDFKKIIFENHGGVDTIFNKIQNDDEFVKSHHLEGLRETLSLQYPDYILALAMGAGKTVLIGSIIATEFAMALECHDDSFVKNALVFAPGKTILGALKEIAEVPYEKILPPRLYKPFSTALKITYTRDGEKDIPIIPGSNFNIIITNTEKIRLQKQTIPKSLIKIHFANEAREDEARELVARRRLQTITSLPNLAIFADEGDMLFGQQLGKDLKRVRATVNYISEHTNVMVVINTTGTPYYKKQILKDIVYWYSLSQGIRDNILKEVRENIIAYEDVSNQFLLKDIVKDFFKNYKNVKTNDGSLAKLAIYFPNIQSLREAKPVIEETLISLKIDPSVILEVHNESPAEIKDLFNNRVNDPKIPYRMFLLVNMGTRGWNCPSLFATALARKLTSSGNFVLQAASRCLRQVPFNQEKAKIYLSKDNVPILDSQLKETYGETLENLNQTEQEVIKRKIILNPKKIKISPVIIQKQIRKIVPLKVRINSENIKIKKPKIEAPVIEKGIYTPTDFGKKVLAEIDHQKVQVESDFVDVYSLAVNLAETYRLSLMPLYEKLKAIYPNREITEPEAENIQKQVEKQTQQYKRTIENIEQSLALIKKEGFEEETEKDKKIYVAEISINKTRLENGLLVDYKEMLSRLHQRQLTFGFHYSPYNFDSGPEKEFFEGILRELNENPDDVEDIYFTGAITDPKKTDFIFEYKDSESKWRNYSPDFLIRKKNGKMLIVEIKGSDRASTDKVKSVKKEMKQLEKINPERLKYEILEVDGENLGFNEIQEVKNWIRT